VRKEILVGSATVMAACLLSFSAQGDRSSNSSSSSVDVRRVKSQPRQRMNAALRNFDPTPGDMSAWQKAALREQQRSAAKMPRASAQVTGVRPLASSTGVPGLTWVNVGPTDAAYEYNGSAYSDVDSGRPTALLVDPRDPNVVYDAVSGGGVWKTYDFVTAAPTPTWIPIGDTLSNLAIGAMALDPKAPDTLYIGTGDSFDVPGNQIFKSTDGGASWSAPVALAGVFPGTTNPNVATAIRDIRVDPENSKNILVASNQGLFRSTNAGATFSLIDLPNGTDALAEATWSLAYLGNKTWLISGALACDVGVAGPRAGFGTVAGGLTNTTTPCKLGNPGDIWRSTDGAATWVSLRNTAGAFPTPTPDIGRIMLSAGPTSAPATTVVYAFAGNLDEWNTSNTSGILRSTDAGKTWKDATGTLANPTKVAVFQGQTFADCVDMNVGHDQSWYNQSILVDPTNPDHVLIGGNLCGVRTLNGTADSPKWENVAHWLPTGGGGTTNEGILPYVHADWHAQTASAVNGTTRVLVGTDGGVFSSTNLFDPATTPVHVAWANHNRGLANHLCYTVASGDPTTGDGTVVFSGLQDNGTRYRGDVTRPTVFDQIIGGDGIGTATNHGTRGTFYWGSVEFGYQTCFSFLKDPKDPKGDQSIDCSNPQNWNALEPQPLPDDHDPRQPDPFDAAPFFVRFAPVPTDATGVGMLTSTNAQVWLFNEDPSRGFVWKSVNPDGTGGSAISPDFSKVAAPNGPDRVINMAASKVTANVYGAVLTGASPFAVTLDGTTAGWRFAKQVTLGSTSGSGFMLSAQSMDFPIVTPAGSQPGQAFIGSFSGLRYSDGQLVPDEVGHVFRTVDGGQTWKSLVGADVNHRLPNVPVWVVKYDPVAPGVIYAGTLVGVYISKDDGATWDRFGDGLPMVSVRDLLVAKNQEFVRIATYGRGVWEIYPSATENKGVDGDGDYDRNLQIDWVDLGALGARLGTNPSVDTKPLYTWIDDMTGAGSSPPVSAIDDNDLKALLAGFGGHP